MVRMHLCAASHDLVMCYVITNRSYWSTSDLELFECPEITRSGKLGSEVCWLGILLIVYPKTSVSILIWLSKLKWLRIDASINIFHGLRNVFLASRQRKSVSKALLMESSFLDFIKSSFFELVNFGMFLAFDGFSIFWPILTSTALLISLLPSLSSSSLLSVLRDLSVAGAFIFSIALSDTTFLLKPLIKWQ